MTRKYRQRGYQDQDPKADSGRSQASHRPLHREGPRSPRMPGMRTAVKCSNCGAQLSRDLDDVTYTSTCPNCSSDLHSCKNCVHFDPSSRFECTQAIPKRISPKDKRADCEFFEIKTVVEKITTSKQNASPTDARNAFERLFKK